MVAGPSASTPRATLTTSTTASGDCRLLCGGLRRPAARGGLGGGLGPGRLVEFDGERTDLAQLREPRFERGISASTALSTLLGVCV